MKYTLRKLIASFSCASIILTMLLAMASATSDAGYDENNWTFFSEDFEKYSVGTDAFFNQDPNHYSYSKNGGPGSSFDIAEDGNNRYLRMKLSGAGSMSITLKDEVSGPFLMEWDYLSGGSNVDNPNASENVTDALIVTFLNGIDMRNNINEDDYLYLTDAAKLTAGWQPLRTSSGKAMDYEAGKWYHTSVLVSIGKITATISDRDSGELIAQKVYQDERITKEYLANEYKPSITFGPLKYYEPGHTYQLGFDNFKISQKKPLMVLSIGNSYSRDSVHYLSHLGDMVGENIYTAYLYTGSCTLRMHANAAMYNAPIYYYFKSNKANPSYFSVIEKATMEMALADREWDIITLQQGVTYSAMEGTYGGADLDFLLDYIKDTNPQAKIYWNMTWALSRNQTTFESFQKYFDRNPIAQYNATIDNVNQYIKTDRRIDGVINTGYAIELARANSRLTQDDKIPGDDLLRDNLHLSYNRGRLISGMTWLKTLCPDADLSEITSSAVTAMFNNGAGEGGSGSYQDACTIMTDDKLDAVRACVNTAVNNEPQKLPYTNAKSIEKVTQPSGQNAVTLVQAPAPYLLHFPDVTTMDDGTIFLTAYKNISHTPEIYDKDKEVGGKAIGPFDPMANTEGNSAAPVKNFADIGSGSLVLYRSTDNGGTWIQEGTNGKPLLVIDGKKLNEWGLVDLYGSYQKLKGKLPLASDTTEKVLIYADARDGNLMSVHTDVDGDGRKENLLVYTFWFRTFYQDATNGGASYMITSLDGGNTWTKPVSLTYSKRGDLTEFADGEILVPEYESDMKVYAQRFKWINGNWEDQGRKEIVTGADDSSEAAFFAPEGGDTVYALLRESGHVMRSTDRGATWVKIANEEKDNGAGIYDLQQPGFCNIDGFRTFMTFSNSDGKPRSTYGALLYLDDDASDTYGWFDSQRFKIYASPQTTTHDVGDPSSTYLPESDQILVVQYDTEYRSIVGNFLDISEAKYRPTEQKTYVQSSATIGDGEKIELNAFAAGTSGTGNITWTSDDPSVATVVNGVVTAVSNGTATITATSGGVSDTCTVTVSGVGITYTANSAHSVTVSAQSAPGTHMVAAFYNAKNQLMEWKSVSVVSNEATLTVTNNALDFADLKCKVFFFNNDWMPQNAVKHVK